MSVLIKDISFPRKPDQITVIFRFNDPTGDCTHTHYIAPDEIVEVPPHGRLIDADALMHEFAEFVRASNNSDFADVPTWNDAVSLLGSAPTIIEAEEGTEI